MKRSVALAAVGVASIASAQEWRFELSNPVLSPGNPSTFVTLSIDPGPAAYAFAGANLSVMGTEPGWSDLIGLLTLAGHPGQNPGEIAGGDVTGISVGQLVTWVGWPAPGRVDVWRGTFTATDFSTSRAVDLSTETSRFEVYTDPYPSTRREPRTPIEGRGVIQVVPAPAGLALLGLGCFSFAGRRRAAASPCRSSLR